MDDQNTMPAADASTEEEKKEEGMEAPATETPSEEPKEEGAV